MTDKQMIDDEAFEKITALLAERKEAVDAYEDLQGFLSKAIELSIGGYSATLYSFDREAFIEFVEHQVSNIDNELKSLGFSPTPLQQEGGNK